jgi:2'-5' RNA ligase
MAFRAFLAVELSEPARATAAALARDLARGSEGVRWARPEAYHVTLHFLGDVEPDAIPGLARSVGGAVAAVAPFRLRLGAPQLFPDARRPRVVALGLEPAGPLLALAEAVARGVAAAGLPAEARPFRAHLTLGRIPGRGARVALPGSAPPAPETRVREVILFQSELLPRGARHTPLERFALGAGISPDIPTSEGEDDHGEA